MGRKKTDKRELDKAKNLKRKVERLRKQLRRYEGALLEPEHLDDDLERDFEEKRGKETKDRTIACPKCKEPMELMDLGRYTYKVCTNRARCWHRERT